MHACLLWIDSEHAKLFKISADGVKKQDLKAHGEHAKHSGHTNHSHNAEERFFHDIAQAVGAAEELLVVGPGLAKTHFKTHLEKHNHHQLAKAVVGVESMDHLTDNQILEAGRKFFKRYNSFNSAI